MMKRYAGILLGCLMLYSVRGQLPDGSIAPDFNLIDIDGKQHHLYSYLSQGKTVILNFSQAFCSDCWNYFQSGALQDFYTLYGPTGTDEATVIMIESDPIMGLDDLNGNTSATAGDWVSEANFAIIDDTAANDEYMPNLSPTVYGIHPDKTIRELGRAFTEELFAFVQEFDGPINQFDTIIKVDITNLKDVSCAGFTDGAIDLTVDGPALEYMYEWNTGATTEDLNGLAEGVYRATITDNLENRHIIDPITVTEPDSLLLLFLRNTPTSETANNGSVVANVSGGTPPYSYIWNTGDNTFNAENLGEGTYSVQVFDANGCQISDSVRLEVPDCSLVLAIGVEPTSCDENPDGSIELLVEGSQGALTFAWSNGATTQSIGGLKSGGYQVTVTDAQGCTAEAGEIITIDDQQSPVARIRGPITLYLNDAGEAELSAAQVDSGSFDNCGILDMQLGQMTYDCGDIGRNFIEFTVIDNNLNITTRDVEVTVLDTIETYWICTDTLVVAGCDGVVNYLPPRIIDNCGTGSVTVLSGLGPGAEFPEGSSTELYSYVSGTGERVECAIEIVVEDKIEASTSAEDVECPGGSTGSATIVIDNAANYSFNWSNGQTTQSATNLLAGNYSVTVTDQQECTFVRSVTVNEPPAITILIDSIKAPDGRGDVFITPIGGEQPYRFEWRLGDAIVSTVEDPSNLDFGDYTLFITDGKGCRSAGIPVTVDINTSVKDQKILRQLSLEPNPTHGPFQVLLKGEKLAQTLHCELRSLEGTLLFETEEPWSERIEISPSAVGSGLYLATFRAGGYAVTKKIVVVNP